MRFFVACGARLGINEKYKEIAYEIGKYIGSNNHTLTFGAYSEGMMGAVYKGFMETSDNKDVHGYTKDKWLVNFETLELTKKDLSHNIQERKQKLYSDCDIVLILPGGLGTLDELVSYVEAKETDDFSMPLVIANIDDYYTPILEFFDKCLDEGLALDAKKLFNVTTSLEETINVLDEITK